MQHPFVLIVLCYFVGAIPFGVLIAKIFYGVDIRQHGSKNTGATNVWRVLGKKPGSITLLLDALKGVLPVLAAHHFYPNLPWVAAMSGLAAIIGHNWSIFLKGAGGKGVATSAGVFLALVPVQGTVAVLTFLIVFFTFRRVSVGSMAAAMALLTCTLLIPTALAIRILVVAASLMTIIKHIPNMKRLAKGEEPKVNFR